MGGEKLRERREKNLNLKNQSAAILWKQKRTLPSLARTKGGGRLPPLKN